MKQKIISDIFEIILMSLITILEIILAPHTCCDVYGIHISIAISMGLLVFSKIIDLIFDIIRSRNEKRTSN